MWRSVGVIGELAKIERPDFHLKSRTDDDKIITRSFQT